MRTYVFRHRAHKKSFVNPKWLAFSLSFVQKKVIQEATTDGYETVNLAFSCS